MRRLLWPLLLLAGCSNGPARVVEQRSFAGVAPRGEALLRGAMIAGHDRARRAIGAAPLAWDATLADDARGYAEELARTRRFAHSAEPRGATPQGENLWTGTRGAYAYGEMIGHWIDERRFYRRGVTPNFSTTGKWQDVAHYTQIVWGRTTRFGCAMAHNTTDDYLVCRYTPPGNVVGQVP
ncbi:CAP domain-containing protein [Sphingomonas sp. PB4P5]|uniref:CAP domain-containing protein n=1 Tax=Parasphingomonas puruogangriensis TaxID=3096155 RepID=UPI002FCAA638